MHIFWSCGGTIPLLAQYTQEDYLADPISTALTLGEIADERLEDAIQESIRNTFSGATI